MWLCVKLLKDKTLRYKVAIINKSGQIKVQIINKILLLSTLDSGLTLWRTNRTNAIGSAHQLLNISGSGSCFSRLRVEGGKMAAAESDREPPSVLCSEFLNFSAKDTASVSDSPSCQHCWAIPEWPRSRSELWHLRNAAFGGLSCLRLGLFFS